MVILLRKVALPRSALKNYSSHQAINLALNAIAVAGDCTDRKRTQLYEDEHFSEPDPHLGRCRLVAYRRLLTCRTSGGT